MQAREGARERERGERERERGREREDSFAENDLELGVALLHPQTHIDNKLGKNIYMHMESYCGLGCGT